MTVFIYAAIAVIATAFLIWGAHLMRDGWHDDAGFIIVLLSGVILAIFIIAPLCNYLTYIEFEKSFENMTTYYEALNNVPDIDTNYTYIIDIVGTNKELAEFQGKHELYGVMSVIPDRVMDFKPIGLP